MRRGASLALAVCGIVGFAACGQSFATTGDGGAGDRAVGDETSPGDGATDTGTGGDVGPVPDATTNEGGADCPDEAGSYQISFTGVGCGPDLSSAAPQCITQNSCSITFMSMFGKPTPASGLNGGPIAIDKGGGFTGANIYEGDGTSGKERMGCDGVWAKKGSTLVVECGGVGKQSCIVTLTRTGSSCPVVMGATGDA